MEVEKEEGDDEEVKAMAKVEEEADVEVVVEEVDHVSRVDHVVDVMVDVMVVNVVLLNNLTVKVAASKENVLHCINLSD